MGIIQSIFCSISFCVERVLTWVCCAVVLIVLLFTIVMLMVYGITIGYHYAQKELTRFAEKSRMQGNPYAVRRMGAAPDPPIGSLDMDYRLVEKETDAVTFRGLDMYRTKKPGEVSQLFWDTGKPSSVEEDERIEEYELSTDLSPYEKELARKILGRVRRSRKNNTPKKLTTFLRHIM